MRRLGLLLVSLLATSSPAAPGDPLLVGLATVEITPPVTSRIVPGWGERMAETAIRLLGP